MDKHTKGWERGQRMREWRDRKGGFKGGADDCFQSRLGGHVKDWLQAQKRQGLTHATRETRRLHLRLFVKWCDARNVDGPEWLSNGLLESWLRAVENHLTAQMKPLAASTKEGKVRAVNTFLEYLLARHVIESNPLEGYRIRRHRGRSLPNVLSEDEVAALLAAPDTTDELGLRDRAMLELFYSNGIRRTELTLLMMDDVRLPKRMVMIREGKGGKDRIVPVGRVACHWMGRYIEEARPRLLVPGASSEYVFLTGYGDRFSSGGLGHVIRRYLDEVGIRMKGSCHLLRHACATHMLEHGSDLRTIQTLLGHSRIDTTEIYTHVTMERMCEVHQKAHPRG